MIEQLHQTPETDMQSRTEADPLLQKMRVDAMLRNVHSRYEPPEVLPGQAESQEILVDHETVAYLAPGEDENVSLVVNPQKIPNIARLTPDSKKQSMISDLELERSRLQASIERDLGFAVTSRVLGVAFLDSDSGLHNLAKENISQDVSKRAEEAIFSPQPDPTNPEKNVSGWIELQMSSPRGRESLLDAHLDPQLKKYVGALIAREIVQDTEDVEKEIVLEDFTHAVPEQVVVAADHYNLAEELTTGSHQTIEDLDELIIKERHKPSNRLRHLGAVATAWLGQKREEIFASDDDRLVYH
jgi:hypothetical protein